MKILFLDQSGKLGGAELCLADVAQPFGSDSLVGIFAEGPFPDYLRQRQIPVEILTQQAIDVKKASGLFKGLKSIRQLLPLIIRVAHLSKHYDLIYANTQKALVIGALASFLSRRPLVYHLHDIVSPAHFSAINRNIIITLANQAALVIANSKASRDAFIEAGGRAAHVHVTYNGFNPRVYHHSANATERDKIRHSLVPNNNIEAPFVVGHFSRLSPWKGQHILIEALQYCPKNVVAVLIGDALFGEEDYVEQLKQQVKCLGLENRVHFLGFRQDIPQLMAACDLVAHTSTAPEPFGRVIVEAMLCGTPTVAAAAGGAVELVAHGETGWLVPPGDIDKLADIINTCQNSPVEAQAIARQGQAQAAERFDLSCINSQVSQLLSAVKAAA